MNLKKVIATFMLGCLLLPGVQAQNKSKTKGKVQPLTSAEIDKRVEDLLSKMTLEEKVGQMAQITLDVVTKGPNRYSTTFPVEIDPEALRKAILEYHVGSILNTANVTALTPEVWNKLIKDIQDVATKESRMKIPVIYGVDAIHGTTYTAGATMFPQQIGQAASRNRELVRKGAAINAYETRASSIPWNFSPVLDLGSDPRFPRQWETFGEDPYIGAELGKEMVKGYEGDQNQINDPERVASCIKHFLGYQVPVSGKDRTPAIISKDALYDYHVPAFKAGVEAGSHTLMVNSGHINGIPVHASHDLLTKLLKEELGFKGLVVTDWADIENLHGRDKIAKSNKEAIMIAINAGVDMSMIPYNYEPFCKGLVELVNEGKVTQERIDDAVRRILRVKVALGLFERPLTNVKDYPKFGSREFEQAAYETAAESITLLKNEGDILPLKKSVKVLVTGPNANSMRTLNGGWTYSWQGEKVEQFAGKYNTILKAIQNEIGNNNVYYVPGVSYKMDGKYWEEYEDRMEEAVAAAKDADVVILCLGENSYAEKPGDLHDLYISDLQTELAKKLAATGKPVVLVLNEGRPRVISKFEDEMKAVVQAYLPGNYGGDALADILFGDVNPSGKLPYTYPRYPNSLTSYIHKPSEETKKPEGVYNYEADFSPQYEFAHGLSYTTFEYSNLQISKEIISVGETFTVSIDVANTGKRDGKETVHLFTSDLYASNITPDLRRLRRFEKIFLKAGEKQTITFSLTSDDLKFADMDGRMIVEAGEFEVQIENLKKRFNLIEVLSEN